jgi:hypothetical protein
MEYIRQTSRRISGCRNHLLSFGPDPSAGRLQSFSVKLLALANKYSSEKPPVGGPPPETLRPHISNIRQKCQDTHRTIPVPDFQKVSSNHRNSCR